MTNPRILVSDFHLEGRSELRVAAVAGTTEDEALVGTASALVSGEVVTLYQVYVVQSWRGNGVGKAMVEAVELVARAYKAGALSAIVEESGPLAFWQALGFTVVHAENGKRVVSRAVAATE